MSKTSVQLPIGDKVITFETGQLAGQATASVLARMGDTEVLVTVVEGRVTELGYFPLTVEYVERLYAGGRIKGSRWVKREGRPTDDAILIARLIDRSIRPLFPKEYKNEVQVVVTVLSVDGENEPDVLSLLAVSAALTISHIPWHGPIAAVRVGMIEDQASGKKEHLLNPTSPQISLSKLDMVVSQTAEKTYMIEAGAHQVSEEDTLVAVKQAFEANRATIAFLNDFAAKSGQKKSTVIPDTLLSELTAKVEKTYKQEILAMIPFRATKEAGGNADVLIDKILDDEKVADPKSTIDKKLVAKVVENLLFKGIRENIVKKKSRPDGRPLDEVREISVEVGLLKRTHGSAIFQRGNTQALTVVTLGSPRMEQLIESAEGEESKRYIHHYSMPPYSVGETGRMGVPSRREIGHGALAERAIQAVIPTQDRFPYTIRVVTEVLSSNGSTSMAATCGSTLALMDAGVPISSPVAGIAMGMMSVGNDYVILTDIIGLEDFSGDMDFKVAGTKDGITGIQLDVKNGVTIEQIEETLTRAKTARLFILDKMLAVINESRPHISEYAPKIEVVKVPVEKIGEVIGPGGRVIKNIIGQTGAQVDVEDDGKVTVSAVSQESVSKAAEWVRSLVREVTAGEEFEGTVKRILPFGAFVEILPGKEGMVHVSQMSTGFVKNPSDVVQIGQQVRVRVHEIDDQGRINLSMLFGEDANKPRHDRNDTTATLPPTREPHPLTMQFRRERMGRSSPYGRPKGGPRSTFTRRGGSKFRPSR